MGTSGLAFEYPLPLVEYPLPLVEYPLPLEEYPLEEYPLKEYPLPLVCILRCRLLLPIPFLLELLSIGFRAET